jgi:hypothetical protein
MNIIQENDNYTVLNNSGSVIATFAILEDAEYFVSLRSKNPQDFKIGDLVYHKNSLMKDTTIYTVEYVKVSETGRILYKLQGRGILYTGGTLELA